MKQFKVFVSDVIQKKPEAKVFVSPHKKTTVTIVCFGRFN